MRTQHALGPPGLQLLLLGPSLLLLLDTALGDNQGERKECYAIVGIMS